MTHRLALSQKLNTRSSALRFLFLWDGWCPGSADEGGLSTKNDEAGMNVGGLPGDSESDDETMGGGPIGAGAGASARGRCAELEEDTASATAGSATVDES